MVIAYLRTLDLRVTILSVFFHLISICLCNPPVSWKVQPWFTLHLPCQKLAVRAIKRLTTQEVWFTSWITYGVSEDSYRSVTFTCHNVSVSLLLIVAKLLLWMVTLFSITRSFHLDSNPPNPLKLWLPDPSFPERTLRFKRLLRVPHRSKTVRFSHAYFWMAAWPSHSLKRLYTYSPDISYCIPQIAFFHKGVPSSKKQHFQHVKYPMISEAQKPSAFNPMPTASPFLLHLLSKAYRFRLEAGWMQVLNTTDGKLFGYGRCQNMLRMMAICILLRVPERSDKSGTEAWCLRHPLKIWRGQRGAEIGMSYCYFG